MLTVMGFIVNRLNVSITGMQGWSGVSYFPSWMEVVVTMSIVAAGFIAFGYAVKYLPVFHTAEESDAATVPHRHGRAAPVLVPERRLAPVFRGQVLAGLWILLFIGALAVGLTSGKRNGVAVAAINGANAVHDDPAVVTRTAEMAQIPMELPPDYLFPPSEMSPGQVHFSHQSHVDTAEPKCATCHTDMFSMQKPGMPLSGELSGDRAHENLCGSCHNGTNAFSVEDNCDACHQP
jgi:c(7)-type cytochrome triheme protein